VVVLRQQQQLLQVKGPMLLHQQRRLQKAVRGQQRAVWLAQLQPVVLVVMVTCRWQRQSLVNRLASELLYGSMALVVGGHICGKVSAATVLPAAGRRMFIMHIAVMASFMS
jgi:uncharacterized membrane protein YjdF